ncbi:MAG TPA: hypothetical protein VNQ79_22060 [Blastocatellia bacterium]|nr:hypothetical protein [Blastocatellia bacterium]
MKCIKCGTDNKLKERTEHRGRCKQCGHAFVFDPKATPGVTHTDQFFAHVIAAATAQDTLFITPRQLWYFFCARQARSRIGFTGCGVILFLAAFVFLLLSVSASAFFLLPMALAFAAGVAMFLPPLQRRLKPKVAKEPVVSFEQFSEWLARWQSVNGPIAKLLPPPAQASAPAQVSSEITAYSFDRVVVCQHAAIAQFLIASNFHFEHNCAVLSLNHYPQNIFDTVMQMLRRNPELKVYALHDASLNGIQMTHRLMSDERWFAGQSGVTVYDLGLMPRQLLGRPVFTSRERSGQVQSLSALPAPVQQGLQPEEMKWLEAGNSVELESIGPQRLLQIITLGIARSRDPRTQDMLVPVGTGYYDSGGVYVYSSDSFG